MIKSIPKVNSKAGSNQIDYSDVAVGRLLGTLDVTGRNLTGEYFQSLGVEDSYFLAEVKSHSNVELRAKVFSQSSNHMRTMAVLASLATIPSAQTAFAQSSSVKTTRSNQGAVGRSSGPPPAFRIHLRRSLSSEEGESIASNVESIEAGMQNPVAGDFAVHYEKLEVLESLENDWDGYGGEAPNAFATINARVALSILQELKLAPAGIVPSGENGIGITFRKPGKYADIEFFNSEEILALKDDRSQNPPAEDPIIWEVNSDRESIRKALTEIHRFFNAID